jgi:hypothetical protein
MTPTIQRLIKEALAASKGDYIEAQEYLCAKFDDLPEDTDLQHFADLEEAACYLLFTASQEEENARLRRIEKCWREGGYDDVPNSDPVNRPE